MIAFQSLENSFVHVLKIVSKCSCTLPLHFTLLVEIAAWNVDQWEGREGKGRVPRELRLRGAERNSQWSWMGVRNAVHTIKWGRPICMFEGGSSRKRRRRNREGRWRVENNRRYEAERSTDWPTSTVIHLRRCLSIHINTMIDNFKF